MRMFKSQPKELPVKANNHYQKVFNYSKGEVGLNFTLNIDNKKQLQDFIKIIDQSKKDVLETMEEIK